MVPRTDWESGFERELAWWRGYLETQGGAYPDDFRFRFDPATELQDHIAALLPSPDTQRPYRLLDCAAGPATTLGKMRNGQPLEIVPVDALADPYALLLAELNLTAPIPSIAGEIERLDTLFAPESFDLTHMRFALDHCLDPRAAVQQMIRVTRPTGVVMIEHYRDETETDYQGLRQWDLRPEPGDLVIANGHESIRLSDVVPAHTRINVDFSPTWLTVLIWPQQHERR